MLETLGIPILLKAVDFIFKQGTEILKSRRERMDALSSGDAQKGDKNLLSMPVDSILEKKQAMEAEVNEDAWNASKDHIEHLLKLQEIQTKNYHLAKAQYGKWGSAMVPPIIVHNLEESEAQLIKIIHDLEEALSLVYKREVRVVITE